MDVLAQLRQLISQAPARQRCTVQLLLKRLTGDQVAALMLGRLLYWLPKSQSGWVFKSWRDWQAECGLSRAQVKRVHSTGLLEAIGVERQVRKAAGAPTVHYRVDLPRLLECVTELLGVSPQTDAVPQQPPRENPPLDRAKHDQSIGRKLANPLGDNHPILWCESDQSITNKDSQKESTKTDGTEQQQASAAVVDPETLQRLIAIGFEKSFAQNLLRQYGQVRVDSVVERSRQDGIRNPAGFVRRALCQQWVIAAPAREHYPLDRAYAEFIAR